MSIAGFVAGKYNFSFTTFSVYPWILIFFCAGSPAIGIASSEVTSTPLLSKGFLCIFGYSYNIYFTYYFLPLPPSSLSLLQRLNRPSTSYTVSKSMMWLLVSSEQWPPTGRYWPALLVSLKPLLQ